MTRNALDPARPRFLQTRLPAFLAVATLAAFAGCSGGGGSSVQPIVTGGGSPTKAPTASPTPAASPTPKASATPAASPTPGSSSSPSSACAGGTTSTIGTAGGTITASASTGSFSEVVGAGQLPASTSVSLGYVAQASLPAPLYRTTHLENGRLAPQFTQGAGNTYVLAFCTTFSSAPSSAVSLTGTGVVPSSIAVGTSLNIAIAQGGTYVDVGTALVSSTGNFSSTPVTVALPGVTKSGTYLVYLPASGTNTSQVNFGFALVADDGSGYNVGNGLQFVQIEDPSGNAIPTPTTTFFPVTGSDLDGQSLTPDAQRGGIVDGSNTVYFFSGIPQHNVIISPTTLNVDAYGGDGDSIASLPSGDEEVFSGNGTQLGVISGILSGNPVIADTINNGDNGTYDRDGLVLSADGKVLLSRGQSGLDVFTITAVAAHAGSTGMGTTSYNFSNPTTFSTTGTPAIAAPLLEDGRDDMAISPTDSSRAVIVGHDSSYNPVIQLLTGLTGSSPTVSSLRLQYKHVASRLGTMRRLPEPSAHRVPLALTPSVGTSLYAVSITPDGTTAYVSTDAGILTISGVNTGTLTQVGGAYSPNLPTPGGLACPVMDVSTMGILPDGKYLVLDVNCGSLLQPGSTYSTQGSGAMVTVPIGAGHVLGAPVGQLNNVVVPSNDQMIVH